MSDIDPAPEGRARHWLSDAALGAAVALGAITIAHAALPDRNRPAPPPPTAAASAPPVEEPQDPPILIAFVEPVPGRAVVSPFGLRQMPWEDFGRLHAGVDIAAQAGEPVLAAADGVVVEAGQNGTYGRYVAVRHAAGLTSLYAHLGSIAAGVTAGTALKAGQPLGRIGSTGSSTGPHLHFELRDGRDRPLNPELFFGRAFAEAGDLPLRKAQRYGRRVRVAQVSMIPKDKRALMEAKAEREAAEKALKLAARHPKPSAPSPAPLEPAQAAPDAASAAQAASALERIDGLKELRFGDDGRPRAQLAL